MPLTSISFVLSFALFCGFYFAFPHKLRPALLFIAGLLFYASFNPYALPVPIGLAWVGWFAIQKLHHLQTPSRRRFMLFLAITVSLAVLAAFKYIPFFGSAFFFLFWGDTSASPFAGVAVIQPVGLSFITFKIISSVVDFYRDPRSAPPSLLNYSLYVSFFPVIIAGPIDRAAGFLPHISRDAGFDYSRVVSGLRLLMWGYFKKSVIADNIAVIVNPVFDHAGDIVGAPVFLAVLGYSIQIYCDFSGYTDIAAGLARILGFECMKNFDSPYASATIVQFWSRWHISLSFWLRDYLFLPIAHAISRRIQTPLKWGIKAETWSYCGGMAAALLLGGLWHGARWSFVAWGLYHALWLMLSFASKKPRRKLAKLTRLNRIPRIRKTLRILFVFTFVAIGWILFRSPTPGDAYKILCLTPAGLWDFIVQTAGALSGSGPLQSLKETFHAMGLSQVLSIKLLLGLTILEWVQWLHRRGDLTARLYRRPLWLRWSGYILLIAMITLWGKFEIREFIYAGF